MENTGDLLHTAHKGVAVAVGEQQLYHIRRVLLTFGEYAVIYTSCVCGAMYVVWDPRSLAQAKHG